MPTAEALAMEIATSLRTAQKDRISRINRKLRKRNEYHVLRTSRGWRLAQNLGDYYILDRYTDSIVDHHINLDSLEEELAEMPADEKTIVTVRRQWNDWRQARVDINALLGFHWDEYSGGVHARSPRPFLHAYMSCDAIIDGELAHSCMHGDGPHRIKVCIVKKDNGKKLFERLTELA